jgi:FixJ family two-component response regulator
MQCGIQMLAWWSSTTIQNFANRSEDCCGLWACILGCSRRLPTFWDPNFPIALPVWCLDVRLPGRSGLDFQRDLAAASVRPPIVFITGHGDIPMSVQAMKGGAIEFLTKPFRDQDLLDAVNVGLARDRARRENEEALSALRARFEVLTPRERAILIQVAQGRLNKQIAGEMGITETTVKGASQQHDAEDQSRIARRPLANGGQVEAAAGEPREPS